MTTVEKRETRDICIMNEGQVERLEWTSSDADCKNDDVLEENGLRKVSQRNHNHWRTFCLFVFNNVNVYLKKKNKKLLVRCVILIFQCIGNTGFVSVICSVFSEGLGYVQEGETLRTAMHLEYVPYSYN